MKFVSYFRVSTAKQGDSGLGLSAQRNYVETYCRNKGEIIAEYQDVMSGSLTTRPGLLEAVRKCQSECATLVVGAIDRISRDGFEVMVMLDKAGVPYIDAQSPNDNELVKAIKFSIACEERKKISERTRAALQALKAQGAELGTPENLTSEAREKGLKVRQENARQNENNKRASLVIASLLTQGKGFNEIARELNTAGYKTSRGKEFQAVTVKRLAER